MIELFIIGDFLYQNRSHQAERKQSEVDQLPEAIFDAIEREANEPFILYRDEGMYLKGSR